MRERAMGFTEFWVEGKGALRGRASFWKGIVRALETENSERRVGIGESSVGACESGIPLGRLDEVLHRAVQFGFSSNRVEVPALPIQLIRLKVFRRPLNEVARRIRLTQTNGQRRGDVARDLLLDGEDV